jgi:hypothetical protein
MGSPQSCRYVHGDEMWTQVACPRKCQEIRPQSRHARGTYAHGTETRVAQRIMLVVVGKCAHHILSHGCHEILPVFVERNGWELGLRRAKETTMSRTMVVWPGRGLRPLQTLPSVSSVGKRRLGFTC